MRRLSVLIIGAALLAGSAVPVVAESGSPSRPAIPSAGCGTLVVEPGTHPGTMEVAGVERSWQLAVPSVHDGQTPMPLLIALHGGDEYYSSGRLLALAEEEGFVAAAPRDAYQDWWMVWEPQLPGYDLSLGNPDIALVDALIDKLGEELCLDLARVYATGFSIGAAGTSVLACVLDDRLAAVAPNGGVVAGLGESCNATRPVPVLAVHGINELDISFEGGAPEWFLSLVMKDGNQVRDSEWGQWLVDAGARGPVPDRVGAIAARYGCEPEPAVEPLGEAQRYVWACPEGADVELVAHGGAHDWSSTTDGRTTEQLIWDFFEQHALPE